MIVLVIGPINLTPDCWIEHEHEHGYEHEKSYALRSIGAPTLLPHSVQDPS